MRDVRDRPVGAAEEERHRDGRHGDGVHELRQEEQCEPDRRVLGHEAADQFRVGFDQVEGRAVGLGHHRDEEEQERHDGQTDDVPLPEVAGLRVHDGPRAQRAGHEDDHHDGDAEGGFVGDHLCRGAHRSEQWVLRPRGPAREHHAVDAERGHREQEENPHRRVGQLQFEGVPGDGHLPSDRHDGEGEERGDDGDVRGEDEHPAVGSLGEEVLLEEELDAVGQGLGDPERAGPVGTDAALHVRDHLALEPDHEHDRYEQRAEDHQDLDQHDEHDRPADPVLVEGVAGEERVEEPDERVHGVSSRSSVTGSVASIRSATVWSPAPCSRSSPSAAKGTLNSVATTPRGRAGSATVSTTATPRALRARTRSPTAMPSASRSSGWIRSRAAGTSAVSAGTARIDEPRS